MLPLLPIPIVPEHVWKNVSEKDIKSYAAEPKDGKPVVGSGPFRLVEGTAGGSTYRFEANPDYWSGAPHVDEVVFRVYKSDDPAVQALIKGEVDFVEDITAAPGQGAPGRARASPRTTATRPGFDEIAFNTGAVDTETGKPIGDGNPALQGPEVPARAGLRASTRDADRQERLPGRRPARARRSSRLPTRTTTGTPPDDDAFTFDPDKAGQLLDEAGYKKGADGKRTMPDGEPDRHAAALRPQRVADVAGHA